VEELKKEKQQVLLPHFNPKKSKISTALPLTCRSAVKGVLKTKYHTGYKN
jgi:hypothetical protein